MRRVRAEQIIDGLRQRGFDARIVAGAGDSVGQHTRGVAVHGVCVLGWRDHCRPVAPVSDPAHVVNRVVTKLLSAEPNKQRVRCFPDYWAWAEACLDAKHPNSGTSSGATTCSPSSGPNRAGCTP